MHVYSSLGDLVGRTPLLDVSRYAHAARANAAIYAKLEAHNPAGSAKDRVAQEMLRQAEADGLRPGGTIIEPTSGNTGIGLAAIAIPRGYRVILTMPETMSAERIALLRAYGAELVLTDGNGGMTAAIEKAQKVHAEIPGSIIAGQFDNPANPHAHYRTTGPEIWDDTDGTVDIYVAGVGTGGTLCGAGRYLKEQKSSIRIVAVEPAGSPLLSGGKADSHGLQGIGANFIPKNYDAAVVDEVLPVTEEAAYAAARLLAKTEGVLCGISGGAALHAATVLAKRPENRGKRIVVILPDTGERYLSTDLFKEVM